MPPSLRVLTADRGDAGQRLDLVLRRHLADVAMATRTRIQAWIADGQVTINGAPVRRVSARTAAGDVLHITLPSGATPAAMAAEAVALAVLYEDAHLLAIDKPAGVVVHPTHAHVRGTLMNALLWHARGWPAGHRPSLVGRLDKLTSGIVLVARSAEMHAALQLAMTSQACEKDYLAVVYGQVEPANGDIGLRLARDRSDRRKVVASQSTGALSLTRYQRLALAAGPRAGLSVLRCRLLTGRTHQIRVHLAARGWPIVGDPVYGEPRWTEMMDPELAAILAAFPRQALHAWRVAVLHPVTGDRLLIEAPIPADLRALLAAARLAAVFPPGVNLSPGIPTPDSDGTTA
jgi:23S rRNA pseudouridine1911/1915/1917 synthase